MKPSPSPDRSPARRRSPAGSALIITLAFIAVLTVLLLAFLSRAGVERQIAGASAGEMKADQVAKAGLDIIVTDFRQEIAAGSSVSANTSSQNWPPIYLPASANTTVPARILTAAELNTTTGLPNLVRRSMQPSEYNTLIGNAPVSTYISQYNGAFPTNNLASGTSPINLTTSAAASGRSITFARWNQPALIASAGYASFAAPSWVVVTRNGPQVFANYSSVLSNANPTNSSYVIGRYAYMAYDEGGLLDVNVAGHPTGIPVANLNSTSALCDMTNIPGFPANANLAKAAVNQFVAWRNGYTMNADGAYNSTNPNDTNSYYGYVTSTTNSFIINTQPGNPPTVIGNQMILTRQDLINSITSTSSANSLGNFGFTTNALPYLATFTRQVNAPSFYPKLTNFSTNAFNPANSLTTRPAVGTGGGIYSIPSTDSSDRNSTALSSRQAVISLDNQNYQGAVDMINPALADVRFPGNATLTLPSSAQVPVTAGEPLLRQRFALSRLSLLTAAIQNSTTNTQTESNPIYHYFGLYRSTATSPWVYNHGGPAGSIMTLQELQAAIAGGTVTARDPDFFELLQAAIAVGSLGRDGGAPIVASGQDNAIGPEGNFWPITNTNVESAVDESATLHILQIGANVADEASPNFDPLVIQDIDSGGNTHTIYGTEDLPYVTKVMEFYCPDPSPTTVTYGGWYTFEMWDPYQTNSHASGTYPTYFRITGTPEAGHSSQVTLNIKSNNHQLFGPITDFVANPSFVEFNLASAALVQSTFLAPTVIDPSNAALTFTADTNNPNNLKAITTADTSGTKAHTIAGLFVGDYANDGTNFKTLPCQDIDICPGANTTSGGKVAGPVSFSLQYSYSSSGPWQTYSTLRDIYQTKNINKSPGGAYFWGTGASGPGGVFYYKLDPRTDRWSSGIDVDASITSPAKTTKLGLTPNFAPTLNANGYALYGSYPWPNLQTSGFPAAKPTPFWQVDMNNENLGYYYNDPDGVVRRGDDMYSSGTSDTSDLYGFSMNITTPATTGPFLGRPIMLHRPFQSVGELGYAFRDIPWKSIDFFTSRSGDSALLDVFSAYEEPAVVAGKVDLNTRNVPVLTALLSTAYIDALGNPTALSPAEAANFANRIVAVSTQAPLHNRSDLVNRLAGYQNDTTSTPISGDTWGLEFAAAGTLTQVQKERIKTNREAALRAVSEATASRTWNLMIDVIAQSGRFASSATTLDNFTVEGEKRYWLHIAIDRYTGKIVDEQLEPVYE